MLEKILREMDRCGGCHKQSKHVTCSVCSGYVLDTQLRYIEENAQRYLAITTKAPEDMSIKTALENIDELMRRNDDQ